MATVYGNDPSSGPQLQVVDTIKDFGPGPEGLCNMYKAEIKAFDSDERAKDWKKRGERVIKRYRDERINAGFQMEQKRYNILWSNINTIMPAVYGKPPCPVVMRRYTDPDQVGRVASMILERVLEFQISAQSDFNPAIRHALQDRLLPGMGCVWVRYQQNEVSPTGTLDDDYYSRLSGNVAAVDFVYWEDFGFSPARVWEEVPLVWRIVYMTRQELCARFGDDIGNSVPLDYVPAIHPDQNSSSTETDEPKNKIFKQARVYEMWDKRSSMVYWLHLSCPDFLDSKPDPMNFPGFFPCPKPLFATNTTGNLIPVPDYCMYQDQANQIDLLTQRLYMLTVALKVVGVYDSSQTGIQRMLTEGVDNQLIPVDTWAAFAEKGGIRGTMQMLPLEEIIMTVDKLTTIRAQLIDDIYQITGISDIERGASNPHETLGAQKMKAQFGSVRLDAMKGQLANFVTETLQKMAHVVVSFFDNQTILDQSSILQTPDGQKAIADAQKMAMQRQQQAMMAGQPQQPGMPPQMPPMLQPQPSVVEQAIALLRRGRLLDYRVEVASDSMVEPDLESEQEARTEFLAATTSFMAQAMPAVEQNPQLAPVAKALLMFGIRGFRAGREIEGIIDSAFTEMQTNPQPKPPDPKMQIEQMKAQAGAQADMQAEQARAQADVAAINAQAQADMAQAQQAFQLKQQQNQQEFMAEMANRREELQADIIRMREETQAQVEAILLKANVEAQAARDMAAAKGLEASKAQEPHVEARAGAEDG